MGAGREVTTSVLAEAQLLEERRRLQEWLAQEQQLEGLGVLASGLAHTFNNLLTGILANASASLHALPPGADASALEDSVTSASRAAQLARQLLRNALPAPAETPLVDLSARLREMASLLGAVLPQPARLELDLAEALPGVRIDPAQLRRVLLPLVTGAIEATRSQGGVIRISTRLVELAADHTLLGGDWLEPGWYVGVRVFDDGPALASAALAALQSSIAPDRQARAEPPALDGRALGLLAVLGSMRARLGGVRLQSASGAGSTIELLYPVSSAPPPQRPLVAPAEPAPTREVLLIDDDPIVRRAAARILRSRGLAIAQASSGDEAMELLRSGAIHPGAVVLDFAMPGMNGGQTLRALQQLRPAMRIILCSGYSLEEVGPSIDSGDAERLLAQALHRGGAPGSGAARARWGPRRRAALSS